MRKTGLRSVRDLPKFNTVVEWVGFTYECV